MGWLLELQLAFTIDMFLKLKDLSQIPTVIGIGII